MRINKVEICGVNTAKLVTFSEEEKRELLRAARDGDKEARDALVMGNLKLVLSVIGKFNPKQETLDDLFQVGVIGLIKAIDNFNLELDVKFSTYAVPMIIGEVRRYQRDNNSVRVSRGIRDLAYRALQTKEEIARLEQREATLSEIAKRLETDERSVGAAIEAIAQPVSLFDSVYGDGEDTVYVIDKLADESESDESWVENISLKEAMKKLSPREMNIIERRFYKGRTQMEIAAEIGISQAQVSRLEKGAIDKLRKYME
ncbi:MAG: RNA polymerase sporulation sigma factor SigG [Clostridia bacterium]|nr:RNA polymerase sporulation sigma factor SigG [Clostridia bacterium]MBR3806394.1 RNA polymerase sporulation sigma factor SigG [Clostridia bacterium]